MSIARMTRKRVHGVDGHDEQVEQGDGDASEREDHFHSHFSCNLDESEGKRLLDATRTFPIIDIELSPFANCQYLSRSRADCPLPSLLDHQPPSLPRKLREHVEQINGGPLREDQRRLYSILSRYSDVLALGLARDGNHQMLYCAHVLHHALRTRRTVIANKRRLDAIRESRSLNEEAIESCRDQGLARPKCLILCPFKKHARALVDCLIALMFGDAKPMVTNSARFYKEFTREGYSVDHRKDVDDEYRTLMSGNVDDCFRLGIAVAKKSLKLYTDFLASDILIASPLGLRMIVGDAGEAHHEHDFLASIEVLVIDQADVLLMQNWDHLLHLMANLHIQPAAIDVDISRVRQWTLSGFSALYRQTLLFASVATVQFRTLFSVHCHNHAGQFTIDANHNEGILDQISVDICQELHRFEVTDAASQSDLRFAYFRDRILPQCTSGTLIFIADYFDYVRVRNHLKRERASFVQLHEYAKNEKVARARDLFFHGKKRLLLLTERFHFFRRYRLRGIDSIVFYQLPLNPAFYAQLINMADEDGKKTRVMSRLMHCKFDRLRLINVFGRERAAEIHNSKRDCHMLIGE